ncbi:hypothetical protein SLT36_15325 [Aminobacter sp. BA135]|uniref:hypothetical protein n=1 Tax=Aminobacter sp. BA135 TaxID=537596 RepID=UPI003D7A75C4
MDSRTAAFAFGGFGGVLPTLANMASTYVSVPATPMPEYGIYLGLLLWAVVGGGVALTNTSYEARQAIFAGVAAPAILLNIVAGATSQSGVEKAAAMFGLSAHAEDIQVNTGGLDAAKQWALVVSPSVSGGIPARVSLPVTAEVKKDGKIETVTIGEITDLRSPTAFTLPAGAAQVFVSGEAVATTGTFTAVDLDVKTAPSAGGDLFWALGAPRRFNITGMNVSKGQQEY